MNAPIRRHACPSLTDPMPTGDGLLARLLPSGRTIASGDIATLCRAARTNGNGIIEITSRGSIQIRGLTPVSTSKFVAAVMPLGIATPGIPVLSDPLTDLDPHAVIDSSALADKLRAALSAANLAGRLAPKVSITVDSGSRLHLDAVPADLRLSAIDAVHGAQLHLALGGTAQGAVALGMLTQDDAVEAVVRVMRIVAEHGPRARARDLIRQHGAGMFRAVLSGFLCEAAGLPAARVPFDPLGAHPLRDHTLAVGFGLPFGHTDADSLEQLVAAAKRAAVAGLRTASRALLVIGVAQAAVSELALAAERLGFIVHRDDPRRHIAACAGAPICMAAKIPTRPMALAIAEAAPELLDGSFMLHLSGCAKGCAHHNRSAMTIVGRGERCDLILNGSTSDRSVGDTATATLAARLACLSDEIAHTRRTGERAAEVLARLGLESVAASLTGTGHG